MVSSECEYVEANISCDGIPESINFNLSKFFDLLPEKLARRHVLVAKVAKVHRCLHYLKFSPASI